MGVYVDTLIDWGWHRGPSCHLIADSVDELISFAAKLGLKPEWMQTDNTPHYDLDARGRETALSLGAIPLKRRDFVLKLREIRTLKQ